MNIKRILCLSFVVFAANTANAYITGKLLSEYESSHKAGSYGEEMKPYNNALIGYGTMLKNGNIGKCSGIAISKNQILTAAHCFTDDGSRTTLSKDIDQKAQIGLFNNTGNGKTHFMEKSTNWSVQVPDMLNEIPKDEDSLDNGGFELSSADLAIVTFQDIEFGNYINLSEDKDKLEENTEDLESFFENKDSNSQYSFFGLSAVLGDDRGFRFNYVEEIPASKDFVSLLADGSVMALDFMGNQGDSGGPMIACNYNKTTENKAKENNKCFLLGVTSRQHNFGGSTKYTPALLAATDEIKFVEL